jgi:uncharacterized protein YdeI (YjbR/CyaY-like superfamily)
MEIGNTLYVTHRKDWRAWLAKNFDKEREIWLIYPHKSSGKPRISYNDAVEEALCYGWIDSTAKKFDADSSAQRFSRRNPKSPYSQANKERLRWLMKENKLHPTMQDVARRVLKDKLIFPKDILRAIEMDKEAWKNYRNYSLVYRRIRVAYIDAARQRPEEFKKRLDNFIKKTKKNKQIGFGGIEKYY